MGESSEPRMQNGSDDGTNDRGGQVQPNVGEIASRDHRPERTRWVEGRTGECSTHKDVEGQRHPDRKRSEVAGAARNRRAEYDCDKEKGKDGLDNEASSGRDREGGSTQGEVVREC